MFVLLALLEDSGYMARAAVVTDRLMRAIGLPGRAFLPLIVGFGCNVPAISATRILPSARHRVMTALLVPFTSCSARLTVYVLVATTFFPHSAGTVVFAMYVISITVIVLAGLGLRATLWRTVGREPLVLDLPPYQRPTLRLTASVTWLRVYGFLRTAGGIIVLTVTAVWLLQSVPVGPGSGSFGEVAPAHSLFAALARVLAPVFAPLGFGDWHTVGALVVGFVAKEAVITSWAQTYAAADPTAGLPPHELQQHVGSAFAASSGSATVAAVWAFLLFLLAYTPCVATLAAQRREIGARWTAFGLGMQLTIAWLLGCAAFQIGRFVA
jgi:ferrous iron transport protein B